MLLPLTGPEPITCPECPPAFPLGEVLMTPGTHAFFMEHGLFPWEYLTKHQYLIWGDPMPEEDMQSNFDAIKYGGRIFTTYIVEGEKIWIITEADRSSTTILFPSEY